MSDLVSHLASLIIQDNAVLFVGAALRRQPGQQPLVQQIAQALAEQIDYQRPDRSLPAVARDYEVLRGRRDLIQAVRQQLQQSDTHPTAIHQLIADAVLPSTKVITTRFDRILENALDQTGKPYVLIVRDTDVPFFDETKVTLIKMQGDITQPDSLVLTEDDLDAFIDRLPTISDVVRAFFATKTLIFLGYDLQSAPFKRFYNHVTRKLTMYRRKAYAITPQALPAVEQRYWQQQNVEICERQPLTFLQALVTQVKAGASAGASTPPPLPGPSLPPPTAPYKGLASYEAGDRTIFLGRAEAAQRLMHRILAHRITLLYGEAGVGATSLVQAGVRPHLHKMGALLVDVSLPAGRDLQKELNALLAKVVDDNTLNLAPESSLTDKLRSLQSRLSGPVILSMDPFQPMLAAPDTDRHQENWHILRTLAEDRSLDLRWLWVLHTDQLGELPTPAWWEQPAMFARFRLDRLSREAARSAIVEPARQFNFEWDETVVEQVLDELESEPGRGILPASLQLVCQRLLGIAEKQGTHRISAQLYSQSGGVQTLLSDYLDHVINELPAAQQPTARTLLAALVSSGGSRQRLTLAELCDIADIDEQTAAPLLDELVSRHLLQRWEIRSDEDIPRNRRLQYELLHHYLATSISLWLNEAFWMAQKAREVLRRNLPGWLQDARLLAADDLRTVAGLRGQLRLHDDALDLLYASAVALDADATGWAPLLAPDRRSAVLLRLQKHVDATVRCRALRAMAGQVDAQLAATLATTAIAAASSEEKEVAATAIAIALQTHGNPSPLQALLAAAATPQSAPGLRSALVLIRDQAPASHALLPPGLRGSIQRRVWQRRWQRAWPRILADTVQGAQGGFWGLGLSLGILLALLSLKSFNYFVDLRRTIGLLLSGLSMGGVIGVLVVGGAAFVRTATAALADSVHPRQLWMLTTLIATSMFALGMLVFNVGVRGPMIVGPMLATGALLGSMMTIVAAWPGKISLRMHLLATMLAGAVAFLLVFALRLSFFETQWWWLLITGMASGAGLFAGLYRR